MFPVAIVVILSGEVGITMYIHDTNGQPVGALVARRVFTPWAWDDRIHRRWGGPSYRDVYKLTSAVPLL
jgi:hypothetical protein